MRELSWHNAILKVLKASAEPVHYSDIAQEVIDNEYRVNVGATPAATVASTLSTTLKDHVVRLGGGFYSVNADSADSPSTTTPPSSADEAATDAAQMGLINAFGMFWHRDEVDWAPTTTALLGRQQSGSELVDFGEQAGVYLLYDRDRVIYVGRVTEARLGARLREHTRDRLTGRWDRFSWFGVRAVRADGALAPLPEAGIEISTLIATMEALLIEGLEPPQNRRQGDGFSAVEFTQATNPQIVVHRKRRLLAELSHELGP